MRVCVLNFEDDAGIERAYLALITFLVQRRPEFVTSSKCTENTIQSSWAKTTVYFIIFPYSWRYDFKFFVSFRTLHKLLILLFWKPIFEPLQNWFNLFCDYQTVVTSKNVKEFFYLLKNTKSWYCCTKERVSIVKLWVYWKSKSRRFSLMST